jgi:thiosulfate/3-mercaptopyruvate sulfurtransferase
MLHPLITASDLEAKLADPALRLFDCRYSLLDPSAGQRAYSLSHLPGARFIDMNRDLSTPHVAGKTGRHPLPARTDWIARVSGLGITPDSLVVLYDDGGGASASRMWWMLRWIGHDKVVVLDGGWQAWTAAALPVSQEVPQPAMAVKDHYSRRPALVQLWTADAVDGTRQLLLDAREAPRFRGEVEAIDPVAGHIPGASCSPFSQNLQADGRFRSPEALREKFANAIVSRKPVVCYCGSGITACHNILAMAVAGLPVPALYAGSWSEWITDASRPVATGD